jgi:hypothetical protein
MAFMRADCKCRPATAPQCERGIASTILTQ